MRERGKGFTLAEIAGLLGPSPHTVGTFVRRIYRKLEVRSRGEAVFEALQLGLVKLDGEGGATAPERGGAGSQSATRVPVPAAGSPGSTRSEPEGRAARSFMWRRPRGPGRPPRSVALDLGALPCRVLA